MLFYELIVVIRQDVLPSDANKIIDEFNKIIKDYKGTVLKSEYWGFRTLAYEIRSNKRGHYYLLGIEADNYLIKELRRKINLSESIVRFSLIKVKAITTEPSAILKINDEIEIEKSVELN